MSVISASEDDVYADETVFEDQDVSKVQQVGKDDEDFEEDTDHNEDDDFINEILSKADTQSFTTPRLAQSLSGNPSLLSGEMTIKSSEIDPSRIPTLKKAAFKQTKLRRARDPSKERSTSSNEEIDAQLKRGKKQNKSRSNPRRPGYNNVAKSTKASAGHHKNKFRVDEGDVIHEAVNSKSRGRKARKPSGNPANLYNRIA